MHREVLQSPHNKASASEVPSITIVTKSAKKVGRLEKDSFPRELNSRHSKSGLSLRTPFLASQASTSRSEVNR